MRYFADTKRDCTEKNHNFPIYINGTFSRSVSCAKDTDFCKCGKMTFKEYKHKQNMEMTKLWKEVNNV